MRISNIVVFAFIIIFLNNCTTPIRVNNEFKANQKLVTLCKLWGFLKYNHPAIGKGALNWDSVLLVSLDRVSAIHNIDSLKNFYDKFVPAISVKDSHLVCLGDSVIIANKNLNWIDDTNTFSYETIKKLKDIYRNNDPFENKYLSSNPWVKNPVFDNDTSFNNVISPDKNTRLLSLFRYWNIINYYYPYKYLTETPWENVLKEFIPIFLNTDKTLDYHLAVCMLTAKINDNHAYTTSDRIVDYLGHRFLPVKFKFIQGKTIISEIYSDSLALINNLRVGDIIINLDGVSINVIRDSLSIYFSGSNQASVQNTISFYLSRSSNSQIRLLLQRKDTVILVVSDTYERSVLSKERRKKKSNNPTRVITKNTTYIDLSKLTYDNVDSVISSVLVSNVLILDLRKNCKFILHNITSILFPHMVAFYTYTTPWYENPGLFCYHLGEMTGPEQENPNSYNGNIILLFNENTQSIGEFTAMSLMVFENVKTIGNTTAGADGNVSTIYLPGNIITHISGIGIYWPDGKQTQRIGISPDITISPTIESVQSNKDEVLQSAISYARSIAH